MQKRRVEAMKLEKKQLKAARRAARDAEKENKDDVAEGIDPDIAGIVPGPQPLPYDDL
jgi:hypothetical protein